MKRFTICAVLITVCLPASADEETPVPQSTPMQQHPIPVKVKPTVQLSRNVKASIERPDTELRKSAMQGLNSMEISSLGRVVYLLRAGDQTAGQREWQSMIRQITARSSGVPLDINALVQHVLRESYLESNKDLQFYAVKVRYFNELKQAIREHLTHIRKQYSKWTIANGKYLDRARPHIVMELLAPSTAKLPLNLSYRKKKLGTKSEWEAYIKELEQKLSDVGDDAQLANIDLQNTLQKKQQLLQTMSNTSKMLHDTAMAVIRKVSG